MMREQIDMNSIREGRNHSRLPTLSDYWIDQLRGSADFLGLNYYTSRYVELLKEPAGVDPSQDRDTMLNQTVKPNWKKANLFFLYSVPAGLGDLLRSELCLDHCFSNNLVNIKNGFQVYKKTIQ